MKAGGIPSLLHWRLGAVIGLHVLACTFAAEMGRPEPFELAQVVAAAAIAFIVATTLCWQWRLFGEPGQPQNFVGHVGIFFSILFLSSRLYVRSPASASILDAISSVAKWAGKLVGGIPPQVFEVLRSPGVAILFLAVCLALSLRRPLAIGVLVGLSFLAVLLGVTREDFGNRLWYFAGIVACAGALALQYHDPDERHFWMKVYERLKGDQAVRGDMELKYRLLQRLRREGRPLAESECLGAVARALGRETEDSLVLEATGRVARQLVVQDALTVIHNTAQGKMLAPVPELLEHKKDAFTFVAGVPKAIVVGLIALLWVLLPIDLIPDAIPVVGVLDDVVVSILGTVVITNALRSVQTRREHEGVL